ncbi:hypothetical protein AAVH_18582 [Aphelenchoides avenae]|nr:hypothetical protein AAVH_18582 [Aphelenchus avenae]
MYPTPPVCTDDARSDSVCTCGTDTCAANQYCHPTNYPKCVSACVSGDVVSGFSCQCVPATGDGDGSICTDGHTCNVDGTCMAPAPPVCTDNARTYSTCTCGTDTCTSTQYCHTTSNPKCIGVCTTGTAVRGYSCQCVPATGDGDGTVCADGQTCKADGTCPATPPPPCTNDAKTDKPCTCDGTDICAATQYCHKTSNPKCINACTSGSFVSGTSCQCVPSSGGGDGFVCTDGHTCKADGTCPATPAAPCANDARAFSQCACGDETCTAYQYCHLNNDPKCLGVCASGSDVKGTSCQCVPATGGGDGTPCTDGQTCSPDGTCPATVADCTDNALVTSATCKCYTDTCNKGQYCHKTSPTRCVDKCAAVGKVTGMSCQCTTQWHVGSECSAGQTCNADGTCQATLSECPTGPPANTNCTCKDKWCLKGQICVSTGEVGSCFPAVCPATGGAPAGGCICGDNGAKCNQDDACTPATGTRTTPAPPTCPTGSPANAVCTCEDTWCVKGQTCTSAGDDGACSPAICPATGGAPAGGCICGDNGVKCNQDDTCSAATGTCAPPAPPACPVGSPVYSVCTCKKIQCVKGQNCDDSGYGMCSPVICQPLHVSAPAGGCICGDNGAKCNQDYTCTPATGTCTPPPACTDDAKTDKPCTCDGTDTCAANQYCHKTSNPKCLGMCVSGGDVQGTPCQCVPATGGGDGTVCTDGQTCEAEGTCPASFTD